MSQAQGPGREGGERLGVARFEAFLRRLFSVKGEVAPHVAPQISPVVPISRGDLPEEAVLKDEILGIGWRNAAAGALSISHVGLRNPAGSGVVVTLELVAVAEAIEYELCGAAIGAVDNIVFGFARDPRTRMLPWAVGVPTAQLTDYVNALARGVALTRLQGGGIFHRADVVLTPGFEVLLRGLVQNQAISGRFLWRERPMEASERLT